MLYYRYAAQHNFLIASVQQADTLAYCWVHAEKKPHSLSFLPHALLYAVHTWLIKSGGAALQGRAEIFTCWQWTRQFVKKLRVQRAAECKWRKMSTTHDTLTQYNFLHSASYTQLRETFNHRLTAASDRKVLYSSQRPTVIQHEIEK